MRIHVLQHVDFEDEAHIGRWARVRGHAVSRTLLYEGQSLPAVGAFDALVVMGGPMNVYEDDQYPFLKTEKALLKRTIDSCRPVLGICLGAQLVSDVLGGTVMKNPVKEIGWFEVRLTVPGRAEKIFQGLPDRLMAYHWHGDTFSIPAGCVRIAESDACANQGFIHQGGRVAALQFHAESTPESVGKLVANSGTEIRPGKTVQSAAGMVQDPGRFAAANAWMELFLDRWSSRSRETM